jgi:hypothetical protein
MVKHEVTLEKPVTGTYVMINRNTHKCMDHRTFFFGGGGGGG